MLIVQMDWFRAEPRDPGDREATSTSGHRPAVGRKRLHAVDRRAHGDGGQARRHLRRRRVIVIGLAIFGVVSIVCGSAPDEWFLIIARVVHGIGAALIFPVSIAVVSSTFSGARQSRAIGVVLGMSAIGQALGPFVGGTFAEYLNWRGVFFINVPFCVAAIFLMLRYVKESSDEKADRHIDVPGMLTVTGGLVCISLGFDRGEAWGWTSLKTIGMLAAGIALLVVFVAIEKRVKSPLVSLDLFRNRAFDAVVIAGSLSNVVFCFVAVFSALYLQGARGMSPFESGVVFLALSAGAGSASYFSGRLAGKVAGRSVDGDRHADQRRGHRRAHQRDVALALHAALPRNRDRPRAWMGAVERRDAGRRAARLRGRGVGRHADVARDAGLPWVWRSAPRCSKCSPDPRRPQARTRRRSIRCCAQARRSRWRAPSRCSRSDALTPALSRKRERGLVRGYALPLNATIF
jgi:MFS family permease